MSGGVLFLDLATKAGVAFPGSERGRPLTVLWRLPKVEGDSENGREYGALFGDFRRRLVEQIGIVRPDAIGFEAAINVMGRGGPLERHVTSQSTIRVLYGLVTLAEEVAWTMNIRTYECAISSIKKHVTGSGRADKRDVMRAMTRLGVDHGNDDNRADAAAGFYFLSSMINPKFAPASTPLFGRRA